MLQLDPRSVGVEELSLPALGREMGLMVRPNWFLRKMATAVAATRQQSGLGWTRKWNRSGITIFRTHVNDTATDADYYRAVARLIQLMRPHIEREYWHFANNLLTDSQRTGFTFYHNREVHGVQYEGFTVSIGRVVQTKPRRCDRLDLIVEDQRRPDGTVDQRVDRVRLYLCPWSQYERKEYFLFDEMAFDPALSHAIHDLHRLAVDKYNVWKSQDRRQWKHWSQRFVESFGPRRFIPVGSSFL